MLKNGLGMVALAVSLAAWGASEAPLRLWEGASFPRAAELPVLKGVTFAVIKRHEPARDGFKFLHGVDLCWHGDRLWASYGTNPGNENTAGEIAHARESDDGGRTWRAAQLIGGGERGVGVSHGVMLSRDGELWAFQGAFTNDFRGTHTRAYRLDARTGKWTACGVVAGGGFWPMQNPQKMADGNWIMGGLRAAKGVPGARENRPAVAISRGDDLLHWDVVAIEQGAVAACWGEATVDFAGPHVTLTSRPGWKSNPMVAHVATSADFGRTWTALRPTNLPMASSKPFTGRLSTGARFAVASMSADGGARRSPLVIVWSRPGEWSYSRAAVIRHAEFPAGPGESSPHAALSYPCAVERDGKLYVGYSNNGPRHSNDNSAELAVIPLSSLP